MTESYLHFLWKMKRLPFHQLTTTDGKQLTVLHHGWHNMTESGPDFYNARIFYDDLQWIGQIEMHVKSSDWYEHNHHVDMAYNNVILHVVYEHDKEIVSNGTFLPTVELKPYMDPQHYAHWQRFSCSNKDIPCGDFLLRVDPIFLKAMLHRVVVDRLTRKAKQLFTTYHQLDNSAFLYYLIARSFGTKTNSLPFELLTHRVPLATLKTMHRSDQRQLLLQASGIDQREVVHGQGGTTQSIAPSLWKRKGVRPGGFPQKRLIQFSEFITHCDVEELASYHLPSQAQLLIDMVLKEMKGNNKECISNQLSDLLFINAFVPYYWMKSYYSTQDSCWEEIVSFLEKIRPESNHILRKWASLGVFAKNAYESQGLIELYNQYCTQRKCLNCQLGVKIFNK